MKIETYSRKLAHCGNPQSGPTLLCTAALHGNEPAGIYAIQNVAAALQNSNLRGAFTGLAGNLQAIKAKKRCIDRDLNRLWAGERFELLERGDSFTPQDVEEQELVDLHRALTETRHLADENFYHIDLHSTSSESVPFTINLGGSKAVRFALALPIPTISVVYDKVPGSIIEYAGSCSHAAMTIEGGHHDSPRTAENLEAAIWLTLEHLNIIDSETIPERDKHYRLLKNPLGDCSHEFEVFHHHPITPEDQFTMEPGMENFQPVNKGDLLGTDRNGEIRAAEDARLFLPTYRFPSDYGFFLIRNTKTTALDVE